MTSSSLTDRLPRIGRRAFERLAPVALALGLGAVAGCLADNAEDTDLPWASSNSWEGMAPIAPSILNQYD